MYYHGVEYVQLRIINSAGILSFIWTTADKIVGIWQPGFWHVRTTKEYRGWFEFLFLHA